VSTYHANGVEYCKACKLDLTLTRKMALAHECDPSDVACASLEYRRMLEDICNDIHQDDEELLIVNTSLIDQARKLLGWD